MFGLASLFVLFAMAGVALVAFALIAGLFKLVFKVALLPVTLAFVALKVVLAIVAVVVGLVVLMAVGPVLVVVALVAGVPLLLLGGLAWAALHVV
jgi:hypothetical protein